MLAAVLDCTYCNDGHEALVLTLFQRCREVTLQELNIDIVPVLNALHGK